MKIQRKQTTQILILQLIYVNPIFRYSLFFEGFMYSLFFEGFMYSLFFEGFMYSLFFEDFMYSLFFEGFTLLFFIILRLRPYLSVLWMLLRI